MADEHFTMRFDGDSYLVTADAAGTTRQTVTEEAVGVLAWYDYLDRVRRIHGRHSVKVTGDGTAEMVVRNPGHYVGHHRRHSTERLLRPGEWECVYLSKARWWRTGDLHHLPPFPGAPRHVNDGAPWQAEVSPTTSRQEPPQ